MRSAPSWPANAADTDFMPDDTQEKIVPFSPTPDPAPAIELRGGTAYFHNDGGADGKFHIADYAEGSALPADFGQATMPWDVLAQNLAAEAYRVAHGMTPTEDLGQDVHKARMGQIARLLAKELQPGTQAILAWAGISLYLQSVMHALRHVVMGAEVHPPSRGRHNERVLVYSDRLTVLAGLVQREPLTHDEAIAWWKAHEERLLQLEELPRIIAYVERQMGGVPPEATKHNDVEKIEGMLTGLLGVLSSQKELIGRQREQLQNFERALKANVRR